MTNINETPPLGAAGLGNMSSIDLGDGSEIAPKTHISQAKIELLHDDLSCNVSQLQVQLDCAIAMIYAGDTVGIIYSLRRSKAIWRAISGSAAELVAADAERRSALRQEDGGQ